MSENGEILEKCEFCYSLIAYLHGYCPVCNDTGFVKKQVKEPLPLESQDHEAVAGNSLISGRQCKSGTQGFQV